MKLRFIKFAEDSAISSIGKEAFAICSLMSFTIPPQLTEISKHTFYSCQNLKELVIPENSPITTINQFTFSKSSIETLTFSSKISNLEEGWCSSTQKIKEIIIPATNKNFIYLDSNKKLIAGKSNSEENDYDVFIFASRDVKEVTLPSSIKCIAPYSFHGCFDLKTVKFDQDSNLISIGKNAFCESALTEIFLPSKVSEFGEQCFSNTKLKNLKISPKNENLSLINEKILISKSDVKSDVYDTIVFALDSLEKVAIPSFVKKIGPYSFYGNKKLNSVTFSYFGGYWRMFFF